MRISVACLAALATLAACTPARPRQTTSYVPSLEVREPGHIRIYRRSMPRCPFREVGSVWGRSYRDLQGSAFRLHANAVILDPENAEGDRLTGSAVQFTRADCQT